MASPLPFLPLSNLNFLNVPLQKDYSNTYWFPDADTQASYMLTKAVYTQVAFNVIKKDTYVRVAMPVDKMYNCNYVMYQNLNWGTKWFYAFITRMEWASNNSTNVYIETDCVQTWFFDIKYYNSFVVRQHSETDEVGDNIIPEDVSLADGGYQIAGQRDYKPDYMAVFATCNSSGIATSGQMVNGMYSGAGLVTDTIASAAGALLTGYINGGYATGVSRLQQYPSELSDGSKETEFDKAPSKIAGYEPKNKKLLSSAFIKCFISLYGNEATFNPAYCDGDTVKIKFVCDKTCGQLTAFVSNYSSDGLSQQEGVISTIAVSTVIPESNWAYNQYKNDQNLHSESTANQKRALSQKRINQGISNIGNAVQSGTSAVSNALDVGDAVGLGGRHVKVGKDFNALTAAGTAVNQAAQTLVSVGNVYASVAGFDEASIELQQMQENYDAPATGSATAANTYIVGGFTYLSYGYKIPPKDIVERIDHYLSVYGYKQSDYMTPNPHARTNWTYIKTAGLNAAGDFPQVDLQIIKNAFDKGITFWNYEATFGDYSQDNEPAGSGESSGE